MDAWPVNGPSYHSNEVHCPHCGRQRKQRGDDRPERRGLPLIPEGQPRKRQIDAYRKSDNGRGGRAQRTKGVKVKVDFSKEKGNRQFLSVI